MPTVRLRLPRPHSAQQRVITESKRFNVLCCGRRWGKTELGMDRIITAALPGFPCGWFAPSYKYSGPVFHTLKERLAPLIARKDEQAKLITLMGGGAIEVWSLEDEDAGRSRKYQTIIVDEAAMVKKLDSVWTQSLRATLADYRGSAWFLSTPKGISGYFHTAFQRGQSGEEGWASWQMPTSTNPYIDRSEIESARGDVTELAYSQEYLAQFVSWEGQVFRRILDAVDENRVRGVAAVIGVDWGRVGDYTVFVALDAQGNVCDIDRFRGVEYFAQRGRLEAFWRRLGAQAVIIAENNSMGGPVVEQLQREGLPVRAFTTTAPSKAAIIDHLALAFERGSIRIPNDIALIGELQAFEGIKSVSGLVRYSAPDGMHDDMVMALAIAWSGLHIAHQMRAETQAWEQATSRWEEISPV